MMEDRELKELLKKNLEIGEKSLEILKKMRRDNWYRRILIVIKWLAILGVLAWGYARFQPLLEQLLGLWENLQGVTESFKNLPGL